MELVQEYESERPRLLAIASRILGGPSGAEDVAQEAWLRLAAADPAPDNVAAWLTTVTTRLCLDQLRTRRHAFPSDELPELLESVDPVDGPEADAMLADQVDAAMLVVLHTLSPIERVAFVLHDLFGVPFEDVAATLGRSPAAVRQLASRARRRLRGADVDADRREHQAVVDAFLEAARGGDLPRLVELLAPDAVLHADPAGIAMGADTRTGAAAVADRFNGARGAMNVTVDGWASAAWVHHRDVKVAFLFTIADGLITDIDMVADDTSLALMDISGTHNPHRG
ncbi:sigma-70 family RNA polymerase sigma factor [Nocardioides nematodiphilus]|uniref:sigma-70 family RNA polymerase sigma factor n=1 Tax=Nocardioides nematodiphilus TaxID=2849669 RepID=UPI001CDA5400|nr:sigma-70 family RNA polymerase sigma factor [Nocardioides nematodiphilus]MCA1981845.1 sigma-70 family RNA polymerase sigma factor [Nocardioides nematodiphilus]